MDVERGAAWRRRQRRLRSWWRHEQQTVTVVLATVTHHSHSKVGTANDVPRSQKKVTGTRVGPAEYYDLSSDDGRPTGGERPEALLEPWPQGKLLRHAGVGYEIVQSLDVPVPQMVEQLPNIVQFFAVQLPVVAEQVIEVPKILPHDVPPRRLCRDTQLVEQLVEVPTPVSYSSLLQRTVEQPVGTPVPGGGGRNAGLQGSLPEQSSTAPLSSAERFSERIMEQIVDFLVAGGGLHDFLSRHAAEWKLDTGRPGVCGPMAATCVLGMVRSSRRLMARDVVVGTSCIMQRRWLLLGTHSAHCAADLGYLTGTVLWMVGYAPVVVQ